MPGDGCGIVEGVGRSRRKKLQRHGEALGVMSMFTTLIV